MIKNAWRDRKTRLYLISFISYAVLFGFLFIYITITGGNESELNRNSIPFIVFSFIFLLLVLSFLISIFSSLILRHEIEFLLPKPISKRSIVLRKVIICYFISIFALVISIIIIYLISRNSELFTGFNYLQLFYSGLTSSFIIIGIIHLTTNALD